MIKKPTAFVLGAGASQAYGFPLGAELVDQICDRIGHGNASVNTLATLTRVRAKTREGVSVFKTYGPRCDKFFKTFPPLS